MKFVVDSALCNGHEQCCAVAPGVYDLDDDGLNVAVGTTAEVPAAQEDAVAGRGVGLSGVGDPGGRLTAGTASSVGWGCPVGRPRIDAVDKHCRTSTVGAGRDPSAR